MINWTIDAGTILQIVAFGITVTVFIVSIKGNVSNMKDDITDIKTELKALREVLTTQATQTVRLDNQGKRLDRLEEDIRELRHGEGFVFPLGGGRQFGNVP